MSLYEVRRVSIGKTPQLDMLARECGKLYSQTLVFFWRSVRHQGLWLKPKHLMRLYSSSALHAHTADACVQAFFAALHSWRKRRRSDPRAKPPYKRKWYFRIEYKSTAIHLQDGVLTLSNGKGNAPLVLKWPWTTPRTIVVHWTGTQYEAIATYLVGARGQPMGEQVAGIDLGQRPHLSNAGGLLPQLTRFSLSSRSARAVRPGVDGQKRWIGHDTGRCFLSLLLYRSALKDARGCVSVR
jgi:putative transposase